MSLLGDNANQPISILFSKMKNENLDVIATCFYRMDFKDTENAIIYLRAMEIQPLQQIVFVAEVFSENSMILLSRIDLKEVLQSNQPKTYYY